MKFSIIIPVYNVEKYLSKCLESVFAQTCSDYEIIAVNDGSTDSSREILETYQNNHSNMKLINQKNKGLGGARNTGIQNAQGEFLVFLDSDDYISNQMLESLDEYLSKYKLDILAFDLTLVNEKGEIIQRATVSSYQEKYTELSPQQFLLLEPTSCTKVYRRELFVKYNILFPEKLWYEDFATIFKLAPFTKKIGYLKESFYFYVQQSKSITHSKNIKRMFEIETAMNSNIDYYKSVGLFEKFYEELEWNCILHVLYYSAFRLFSCGYHKKQMEELFFYVDEKFSNWRENKYLLQNMESRDMLDVVINQKYYKFYLKTGFSIKFINPVLMRIKNILVKRK